MVRISEEFKENVDVVILQAKKEFLTRPAGTVLIDALNQAIAYLNRRKTPDAHSLEEAKKFLATFADRM